MKNQVGLLRMLNRAIPLRRNSDGRPGRRTQGKWTGSRIFHLVAASLLAFLGLCLVPMSSAGADPISGGALTSGKAVNGVVSTSDGIAYTFTAVAGKHVTLAITNPTVSPTGDSLQMQVYDASNATDANGVLINTSPTEIDFTPSAAEAGTTTVVISAYNGGATGSFTLTYATDVTGTLTSGVPVNGALSYGGQHADYTFTAVAGKHVTLAITNPKVNPTGDSLQMQVYDASGAPDAGAVGITTSPTEIDFTPSAAEAGATTVVISPYSFGATGSFTLTYATDVTGTLTSGVPVNGALSYDGQHAAYTFTAVAGKSVTLAITNPKVSPTGDSLQMQVYDASGVDVGGVLINTSPTEFDYTPTAAEAGTTTVVISAYNGGATGSFTLTYTGASPPSTSVLVPATGASVSGSTDIDASATNATSVEFRLLGGSYGYSGKLLCTATLTYYGWLCNWNTTTVPNGSYVLVSEASNAIGSAFSAGVTITVSNIPAPTTSVLVPATGATVSGSTTLDASATNATSVEFWLLGGSYGYTGKMLCSASLTYYGWLCSWNTTTVPNGSYVVVSEAFNSAGSAFSPGIAVTVKN